MLGRQQGFSGVAAGKKLGLLICGAAPTRGAHMAGNEARQATQHDRAQQKSEQTAKLPRHSSQTPTLSARLPSSRCLSACCRLRRREMRPSPRPAAMIWLASAASAGRSSEWRAGAEK